METADIVRMTNQIAGFFKPYGEDEAVKEIANHINSFWDPRMRTQFFDYLATGGAGLNPLIVTAAAKVRKPAA